MTKIFLWHSRSLLCTLILWFVSTSAGLAQSNIVFNGGFEFAESGWSFYPGVEIWWKQGAAEGEIHVGADADLHQDLPTVAGRDYMLSFAFHLGRRPAVEWNGAAVTNLTNFAISGPIWTYAYTYARAVSNVTRLRFSGARAPLDDVQVRWVQDPLEMVEQPQSRTAYEGGSVSFFARVAGPQPLSYQWFFNGYAIPGANASTFLISALQMSQAGQYFVVASNAWNSLVSTTAQLQIVPPPTAPEIIAQPVGDFWPAGYACNLSVFAVGDPVLRYQWLRNSNPVVDGTNSMLSFAAIQLADAGTYSVLVSNQHGTVLSLPAVLTVTNSSGGGTVAFDTFTNNAPVYDTDGSLLSGTGFVAQVYAGAGPTILRPVGAPVSFLSGGRAGYLPQFFRTIPDVPTGQTAYFQLRAWAAASGSSYEQARAAGGKFGFSKIYAHQITSGSRVATTAFNLRAGEPFFVAGLLSVGESFSDGRQQFILTGEPAARYLIETRQPPNNWLPWLVLTNTTGLSSFIGTNQLNQIQLYRARLLD